LSADKQSGETVPESNKTPENKDNKSDVAIKECAAVQTMAMVANKKKPPKPLKVKSVLRWNVGPDETRSSAIAGRKCDASCC